MKYIDAEKLIAEIERRKDFYHERGCGCDNAIEAELDDLLVFIDSLQQEQPEPSCKSCGFYENNCPYIRGRFIPYPKKVCKDYTYSVMQEQPSLPSELDETAETYAENILANGEDMLDAIADGFRAGAKWMAGKFAD